MQLTNCRITNAVRCLPPANKPTTAEIRQCNGHLKAELAAMPRLKIIVALGAIAHQALLWTYELKLRDMGSAIMHAMRCPMAACLSIATIAAATTGVPGV